MKDDLRDDVDASFEQLCRHEIVKAFVKKRTDKPDDTKRVEPMSSRATVFRLAQGHRHRGATWHDTAQGVVWLLAYAQHEFEDTGDAFPYFKALDGDGVLFPTEGDYAQLFSEQAKRLALNAPDDAKALLNIARASPGQEHRGSVGGISVGVAVEVVETIEEIHVAVALSGGREALAIVIASFFPDIDRGTLEWPAGLPNRAVRYDEVCFRHVSDG